MLRRLDRFLAQAKKIFSLVGVSVVQPTVQSVMAGAAPPYRGGTTHEKKTPTVCRITEMCSVSAEKHSGKEAGNHATDNKHVACPLMLRRLDRFLAQAKKIFSLVGVSVVQPTVQSVMAGAAPPYRGGTTHEKRTPTVCRITEKSSVSVEKYSGKEAVGLIGI